MKKILVFIDWYKPGYKAGGPIRSMVNMVDHLADKYEFYIITRNNDFLETEPYQGIEPNKWIKTSDNEHIYYFSKENLSFKNLKNLIHSTVFDIAYINGIYSKYFSVFPLLVFKTIKNSEYIVAPRGMLSKQSFEAKVIKKKAGVLLARLFKLYNRAIFHTTNLGEQVDIENLKIKPKKFYQITNFPPAINNSKIENIEKKKGELKLVCTARISNEKNTLFALQCLHNYTYNGNIVFDLYGSVYQQEYWQQCLEMIEKLPSNIKVNYLKDISNDMVFSTLQDHHFLFMPTLGENFGHSILESFICGRPVIISNRTPWKDLEAKGVGWNLDLSEPETFSKVIQKALDLDNNSYGILSENSRNFSYECVDIKNIKAEYCEMFG